MHELSICDNLISVMTPHAFTYPPSPEENSRYFSSTFRIRSMSVFSLMSVRSDTSSWSYTDSLQVLRSRTVKPLLLSATMEC